MSHLFARRNSNFKGNHFYFSWQSLPLRLLTCFGFFMLACCLWSSAQEFNVDELVDHLAQQLKKAEKKDFSPHVLVIDFVSRPGGIKAIGEHLANRFSDGLAQKIGVAAVVDRKRLHSYLLTGGISPLDLADRDVSRRIANQLGANVIVFGSVASPKEKPVVSADAYRINDAKHLGSSKVDIPLNEQLRDMLAKPLDWPASPDVLVACSAGGSKESTEDLFKAAGVTMPTCIHCPNPDYTDAARGAGFQGSVKFDVVIGEQGNAKRIAVIQGDSNGLTAKAIEAIKGWKFKPAMRNGQPVTVCVPIEVVFRLF